MTGQQAKILQDVQGPAFPTVFETADHIPTQLDSLPDTHIIDTEMEYTHAPPERCSHRPPQCLVDFLPSDPHPLHQFAKEYEELAESS
ncbi:hypothetical protein C0995_008269 [Termitomyces sp. Mi166|nr:hypothetical protein C0995_008269 [Termitomyces sp. Mi166\